MRAMFLKLAIKGYVINIMTINNAWANSFAIFE